MKSKIIIALLLAALLCGCRQIEDTSGDIALPEATTEATAAAEVTTTTEITTEAVTTAEATTEAATTTAETTEATSETTSIAETPTLPPASEAVEEAVTTAEATTAETSAEATAEDGEIVEEAPLDSIGYDSEGNPFEIDPDYAYFIVNKEIYLPEDYEIETDYVQGEKVMEKTAAYFCRLMLDAAEKDGIQLKILSTYRTVKYQERLFERNVESRMEDGMTYEEAVADVSINIAPPGASEHNAGLAADIITMDDWDTYEGFEDTAEFDWLQAHAAEYGFIMRYHKGKEDITGYIYEPWHYRYVGVKYAKALQDSGLVMEEYFALYE